MNDNIIWLQYLGLIQKLICFSLHFHSCNFILHIVQFYLYKETGMKYSKAISLTFLNGKSNATNKYVWYYSKLTKTCWLPDI